MYHTIGQRQGLGIGGLKEAGDDPWYVLGKDLQRNVLLAGQGNDHPLLFSRALLASRIYWVNPVELSGRAACGPRCATARATRTASWRKPPKATARCSTNRSAQ